MSGLPAPRILLVEDEPDILTVALAALETDGGFVVEGCTSGVDALCRAVERRPDIVLLDVMMPGMDGPSTLEKLRAHPSTADLPVIFMTAKIQPQEVRRYLSLGALAVIPKPFDPLSLGDDIRSILKRRAGSVNV